MKNLLLIILLFVVGISNAQTTNKRINIKNQLQLFTQGGVPVEDGFIMSNAAGKAIWATSEDAHNILALMSESAVDSIWTSGDSLYITFFNAPTIGYRTNGLNGLYSLSNNNKVMSVYQTTLGTNGWTIQKAGGTYGMTFNNSINATVFNGSAEPVRTNNQMGFTGGGRTWRAGASGPLYAITDATTGGTPTRFSIAHGSLVNSLTLRSDGDVQFGNYTSSRPYDFFDGTNFAFFNSVGTLKKGNIDNLVDIVADSILIVDQQTNKHQLFLVDEAYTTTGADVGFEIALGNLGTNTLANEDDGSNIIGVRRTSIGLNQNGGVRHTSQLYVGGGVFEYEIGITEINQLSSASEEFRICAGLLASGIHIGLSVGDMIGFMYDSIGSFTGTQASAQWQIVCFNDASNEILDTDVLVQVGVPYHLKFIVNDNATSVEYFINGVSVGVINNEPDIPNDGYLDNMFTGYVMSKQSGSGNVSMEVDYQSAKYTYTTPKWY